MKKDSVENLRDKNLRVLGRVYRPDSSGAHQPADELIVYDPITRQPTRVRETR